MGAVPLIVNCGAVYRWVLGQRPDRPLFGAFLGESVPDSSA
ncbi:MAG: hypothetical protein U0800_03865 [Isosphaeraceae bacterium]